jgi:cation:H+ antiporter
MILTVILLLAGFYLLIKGGDWLVDGAAAVARRNGVSELIIGLTIVAFGTSAPELVVSFFAALGGNADISVSNVVGSNIFNLLFILGVCGLIIPLAVSKSTVKLEIPFSIIAALVLMILGNDMFLSDSRFMLSRIDGVILLVFFSGFMYHIWRSIQSGENEKVTDGIMSNGKAVLFIILGLAGLVLGGRFVVNSAVSIAEYFKVSQKLIGLTIVAAGTSLPELVTSIVAARKKSMDIAIGNVVGSNIFNIFLILGVSATVTPINYNPAFNTDIIFLIAGTLFIMLAMFVGKKHQLDRWQAAVLLVVYVAYIVFIANRN